MEEGAGRDGGRKEIRNGERKTGKREGIRGDRDRQTEEREREDAND